MSAQAKEHTKLIGDYLGKIQKAYGKIEAMCNGNDKFQVKAADYVEYSKVLMWATASLERYVKGPLTSENSHPDMSKLYKTCAEYLTLLDNINNAEKAKRYFSSMKLRHQFEVKNSMLVFEMSKLERVVNEKEKAKGIKKTGNKKLSYLSDFTDAKAADFWNNSFGSESIGVTWKVFEEAMASVVRVSFSALKYFLDNANTGIVTMHKWCEFMKAFGPFDQMTLKLSDILKSKHFHGFLSGDEALRMLEQAPVGTFLSRLSVYKPGSFVFSYISEQKVVHTQVHNGATGGYMLKEQGNDGKASLQKEFSLLSQVVANYRNDILKVPLSSSLSREASFYGDFSTQEAEELLADKKVGTFMFRFSSKPCKIALSLREKDAVTGEIKTTHQLIGRVPGKNQLSLLKDNKQITFASIKDIIRNSPELQFPMVGAAFDVSTSQQREISKDHYTYFSAGGAGSTGAASGGTSPYHSMPSQYAQAPAGGSDYQRVPVGAAGGASDYARVPSQYAGVPNNYQKFTGGAGGASDYAHLPGDYAHLPSGAPGYDRLPTQGGASDYAKFGGAQNYNHIPSSSSGYAHLPDGGDGGSSSHSSPYAFLPSADDDEDYVEIPLDQR